MARVFSQSGRSLRPAPWDPPSPSQFGLGAGPTIAHMVQVSKRPEDICFVAAASEGNVAKVAATLHAASSPDVHVRLPRAFTNTRATTALHAASAAGATDVVKVLLEARADVMNRHGQLRALTPLHEAANMEVAQLLLQAGASPMMMDPREPDPAWYHEQRKHPNIAALIKQRRSELQNELRVQRERLHPIAVASLSDRNASPSPTARSSQRGVLALPFSAAELAVAKATWAADGGSIRWAGDSRVTSEKEEHVDDSDVCECAICMEEMRLGEDVLVLPCGHASGVRSNSSSSNHHKAIASKPHAFHSDCLARWLSTKSGACPTCRTPLRPFVSRSKKTMESKLVRGQPANSVKQRRRATS